jgi:ataxia telangiectasia mutated family protein
LRAKTKQEKDELTLYKRRLERQFRFDSQERNRVLEERNLFLLKAIEGYLKALSLSDEYDVSAAFNFCSLWFANNTRTDVSQVVNEHLPDARPVVFLPLMYQLSARLSGEQSAFQQLLGSLIVRICSDYPHHSLSHLFALKYAEIETGPRRKSSIRSKRAETLNDRSQAASDILIRIQDQSMKLASIVADTEQMVKAYNELAYWQEKEENSALNSKDRARRWPLPRGSLFQSCTNMRSVQVLTTLSIRTIL